MSESKKYCTPFRLHECDVRRKHYCVKPKKATSTEKLFPYGLRINRLEIWREIILFLHSKFAVSSRCQQLLSSPNCTLR